jgi:hypothetical protein
MPTYIDTTNLSPATISTLQGPIITQIQITTSAYVVKDDTAVSTTGGYIKITGANFTAGTQVVIGTVAATSVTYVNATTLNVQVPAQAAGTYVVYVTTNTGSVAILVNGLTYSGDPVWVTGSTLTAGQIDTPISIQLSATGDAPVTYVLQAGSSLPPGVTLSSGGLLSGTVTGISSETVYNFTIEAIDGQAQESPRTFSITITANDQYFEYVTSLLSAATPTSTFVTDASTNGFAVTVNGDTRPSNFGPYTPGYYSAYFDGTGDYLTAGSSVSLSSDFTVEGWVYGVSYGSNGFYLYGLGNDINSSGATFFISTSGYLRIFTNNANLLSGTSATLTLNTWNHVAFVRSSGTVRAYLNGVQVDSASWSGTITGLSHINAELNGSPTATTYVGGACYISNHRVVTSAVYTSAFTPPTAPLTAIANTSLLTCQSNRFIDNSTNNFTISRFGDTLISGFDPFLPSSSYVGYGSGYFDGTGDSLSLSNVAALQPGSGDFTIECWINTAYASTTTTASLLSEYNTVSGSGEWILGVRSNVIYVWLGNTSYAAATAVNNQAWNHIAWVRSGSGANNNKIYVNGVQDLQFTDTTNLTGNGVALTLGAGVYGGNYTGYISNARLVKGTAVYTSAFTPPTTPLTAIANTSLLTLQNNQPNNNSMFLDASTNNFNITRNGNTTQGTFSPYGGGWSAYFDGDGDNLILAPNAGFSFGTGDFTVEFWVYYPPYSNVDGKMVLDSRPGSTNGPYWVFGANGSGIMTFTTMTSGGVTISDTVARTNQWVHYAATRSGTSLRLFANGTQVASATNSDNISSSDLRIGTNAYAGSAPTTQWVGYISNVRVVKGTAVYTSNFTPSTTPLTPIANTQLLTCADNRFIDDSPNNFAITRNGNTSIQRFNPFNPVTTTPTSYSGYFDGSAAFLSLADNTAFNFGTGDATVEFWFNSPGTSNNYPGIISSVDYNTSGSASIRFDNTGYKGKVFMYINGGGDPVIASTSTISYNTWTHVAITRSGTSLKMYINGTLDTTVTISVSLGWYLSYGGMRIGRGFDVDGASAYFPGYVSNVRLVKGSVVYTANFTPSTTPLTAIANTSLLTCQSATFIDNSANNFTITANGAAAPRQFNPFGWTSTTGSSAAYTPALYGGSGYFDGTGDYLSLTQSALAVKAGNFTIECWTYITGSVSNCGIWQLGSTLFPASQDGLAVAAVSSAWQIYFAGSNTSGGTAALNTWYHLALVRSGTNLRLYVNGISVISVTDSTNYTGTALSIGGYYTTSYLMTGYVSDMRITAGVARYTSNFQPPIAPLTALPNTVLLNNMTGAGIYDSSMIANYETVGNAGINTALKKYGNTSMYFDGTGDYVFAPSSATTRLAGDFTIELWAYRAASGNYRAFTIGDSVGTSGIEIYVSGANWVVYSNSATRITGASATREVWTHLALVRSGSTVTLYVNGTASGSTWSSSATFSGAVYVGAEFFNGGVTSDTNGYIDDFRITNGIARYTTTFTPPTSPYIRF